MDAETISEKPFAATVDRDWTRAWGVVVSVATFIFYFVLDLLKVALFVCCVVPAALINYESMAGRSNAELAVSVMSAIFAAFGFVVVFSDRSRVSVSQKLFAAAFTVITISYNVRNAVGISAAGHQIAQDNFGHAVKDEEIARLNIGEAQATFDKEVEVAGLTSVATYESRTCGSPQMGPTASLPNKQMRMAGMKPRDFPQLTNPAPIGCLTWFFIMPESLAQATVTVFKGSV
jgi:hypothetical protein